ncbi:ATP-dependent DNA helicase II 70 kDa subunit [Capsaspora owczarzaki ATCC 30864]|uniref:DNA helicase n=1 Tax=Capsaspora owczarzaki (strain ATCC 30864) TaxID=595528 RepID=A0A0D2VT98_CAPO3|nr:ATP-dependent DNA helicase II 70 kDa subunit [Capsaspora owczarzaki ATCC 30864]
MSGLSQSAKQRIDALQQQQQQQQQQSQRQQHQSQGGAAGRASGSGGSAAAASSASTVPPASNPGWVFGSFTQPGSGGGGGGGRGGGGGGYGYDQDDEDEDDFDLLEQQRLRSLNSTGSLGSGIGGTGAGAAGGVGAVGDDNDAEYLRFNNKDAVIFAIDCSDAMFETLDNDEVPFTISALCAKNVLSNKIISSDHDLIGVVLFNTKENNNKNKFKHVYVLQPLDTPDVRRIVELEDLVADPAFDGFNRKIGHSSSASIHDVLWTCFNMFSDCATKVGSKRILIFTNEDDPHEHDAGLRRQAVIKAKDLYQLFVTIELLPLGTKKTGERFDMSKFYKDIVLEDLDDELGPTDAGLDTARPDPSQSLSSLMDKMRRKTFKKRALMKIPFVLGDDVQLGVRVYNLCSETKKGSHVWLHAQTNKEIKTVSKMVCQDTASLLMASDIKNYFPYGGEKVIFDPTEVREIRRFGQPGLVLMGFKPTDAVKLHYNVKTANFIYPDETVVMGSTLLFHALLMRLADQDKVAICRFIPRINATPRFVALVPQLEVFDANHVQLQPPGFHVIYLPFADDLRSLQYEENEMCGKSLIVTASDIIKKLTFSFSPWDFENPNLQKHYRNLEALALGRDVADDFEDNVQPDLDGMEKQAGVLFAKFRDEAFPPDYNPDTAGTKPRPKRRAEGDPPPVKRVRLEDGEKPDVEKFYKDGMEEACGGCQIPNIFNTR